MELNGHGSTAENRLDVSAGGLLIGPGTEMSDDIFATMPAGAYVLNAEAVRIVGSEKLQRLVSLATAIRENAKLADAEFVMPPHAVAVLGRSLLHSLNDAGNILRDGVSPDPAEHRALVVRRVDEAIEFLQDASTNGLANLPIKLLTLGEDSRTCPVAERGIRLAGGGLGIALGAGVEEINRQRQFERLDKVDARADEQLAMNRQTHAQTVAANGIRLKAAQQEQTDQEQARQILTTWATGRKKLASGDFSEVPGFLDAYNKQSGPFNDGATMALQSTPQGQVINHIWPDGKPLGTIKLDPQTAMKLYDNYMTEQLKYANPELHQKSLTAEAAAREKQADRDSKKEVAGIYADARLYGADVRADTGIEIANIRAGASRDTAAIRAKAAGSKGLTAAQERANLEIQAARDAIAGLTTDEIRQRTMKATDSGRDNPDYDQALANQARLASRRKIGTDDHFDQRAGRPASAPKPGGTPIERAKAAMSADPAMAGFRLGEQTGKGFKVFDKDGRHVGFYGSAK